MGIWKAGKRRLLAGVASIALVASALAAAIIVLADSGVPTLHIDGVELRTASDESMQVLLQLSVSDVERLTDVYLSLNYNKNYLAPSEWDTNKAMSSPTSGEAVKRVFSVDESIYDGDDPFVLNTQQSHMNQIVNTEDNDIGKISFHLTVQNNGLNAGTGRIDRVSWSTGQYYYITCEEEGKTPLGTISFRVAGADAEAVRAAIQEMVTYFDDTDGTAKATAPAPLPKPLLQMMTEDGRWGMMLLEETGSPRVPYRKVAYPSSQNEGEYKITINFIDAVIHAEVVQKKVSINAYQAYTDGRISDLALAMQNYADSVRVTYASGNQEDWSMYWGEYVEDEEGKPLNHGMLITDKTTNATYRFTWDNAVADGYTFEQKQPDGTFLPIAPQTVYNPKQGEYTIQQYFTYEEEVGIPGQGNKIEKKAYPVPVAVELTVTPVELLDAEVDRESLTYMVGSVPYTYSGLELADEARLSVNATPNLQMNGEIVITPLMGVIPTMPVTWNPDLIENVVRNTTDADGNPVHWPVEESEDTNERAGNYDFSTKLKTSDIEATYPWLTIPAVRMEDAANGVFKSLSSVRSIVITSDSRPWAKDFEMRVYPNDDNGYLTIEIAKRHRNDDGTYNGYDNIEDVGPYSVDIYQSDGTLVDKAWFGTAGSSGGWPEWTGVGDARYWHRTMGLGWADNKEGYIITLRTRAYTATTTPTAMLETLQRNINLGGWFGAELENTDGRTDRLTAYSVPRQNIYTNNYILEPGTAVNDTDVNQILFDFTGNRSGLLGVYPTTGLSTLVTLPDAESGDRASEWVRVRYDAVTGAEPGYIRQFKVDQWSHENHTGNTITYGEDPADTGTLKRGELFAATYVYSGFGVVENLTAGDPPATRDRQVKVRVELQEEEPPKAEELMLTYEQFGDSIVYTDYGNGDEVKRVVFNTRQVDYTYQQVVTLTLTNIGDEEVKGLYVDLDSTDTYFTILSQPAPNLAPGASTTFRISYVPNLQVPASSTDPDEFTYLDENIRVIDGQGRELKKFEAELTVTKKPVYKVTLVVRPEDLSMGTAGFVTGVDAGGAYDDTAAGSAYAEGKPVWVLTTREDQYELIELDGKPQVYYYINNINTGNEADKVYLEEYLPPDGSNILTEDERLFSIVGGMPDYPITVYVDYYEPLWSKLRLSDLHAYAWPTNEASNLWDANSEKPLRETSGSYNVIPFDPDTREYLVMLDEDDSYCGLSVTLWQILAAQNALEGNPAIHPRVTMKANDLPGLLHDSVGNVDLTNPSEHRSVYFAAPEEGNTRTVTVTISYDDTNDGFATGADGPQEQTYTVIFARRPKEAKVILQAGNSPYGMIENDDTIQDKDAAKRDYDIDNRFTFTDGLTPVKAYATESGKSLSNIYWPEAWNRTGSESNIDERTTTLLDKNVTALFVYMGQEFLDPGAEEIKNSAGNLLTGPVNITLNSYYELEGTAADPLVDRFNSNTLITTNLLLCEAVPVTEGTLPQTLVEAFAQVINIRPGVYRLTYTFQDYVDATGYYVPYDPDVHEADVQRYMLTAVDDGEYIYDRDSNNYLPFDPQKHNPNVARYQATEDVNGDYIYQQPEPIYLSFSRPLVILSANGDINADLTVATRDADLIRSRYTEPLPTEAVNYLDADRRVYRYRILDVNNDRNINNIDSNMLRWQRNDMAEFYRPVDYINRVGGDRETD